MAKDIIKNYIKFLIIWIILFPVYQASLWGGVPRGFVFFNLGASLLDRHCLINIAIIIVSLLNLLVFYKIKSKPKFSRFSTLLSVAVLLAISWLIVYFFKDYFTIITLIIDF